MPPQNLISLERIDLCINNKLTSTGSSWPHLILQFPIARGFRSGIWEQSNQGEKQEQECAPAFTLSIPDKLVTQFQFQISCQYLTMCGTYILWIHHQSSLLTMVSRTTKYTADSWKHMHISCFRSYTRNINQATTNYSAKLPYIPRALLKSKTFRNFLKLWNFSNS